MSNNQNYYVIGDNNCRFPGMTKEEILTAITQAVENHEITDIDTGFVTTIIEQNTNKSVKFWIGTTAQFNALAQTSNDVFYIITDYDGEQDLSVKIDEMNERVGTAETNIVNLENEFNNVLGYNNAGFHNSFYRGKNLGNQVTAEQYTAIDNGTFDDMYIGDYWTIVGVIYRIAAFDYFYGIGTSTNKCTKHHVVIVPDNVYGGISNGGTNDYYYSSTLRTVGMANAKAFYTNQFGENHILKHYSMITLPTGSGKQFAQFDIELMSVGQIFGIPQSFSELKSQFPIFAINHNSIMSSGDYWVRDYNDNGNDTFSVIKDTGTYEKILVSTTQSFPVRVYFCIYGGQS